MGVQHDHYRRDLDRRRSRLFQSKGLTKIGLLNPDSAFGVSAREQWERQLPAAGMTLVIQETFSNSDQDMTPQLTKIRGSEAQANVIWAAGPVQAIAVKNYRQLGIDRPLMLPNGATDPNLHRLAGDAVNGVIFAASKLSIWEQLPDTDPQKALFKSLLQTSARNLVAIRRDLPAMATIL